MSIEISLEKNGRICYTNKVKKKTEIVMRYDTVIFDLDGTLLDTLSDLHASVCHALIKNGMAERTLDEVRRFVGNGIFNLIKRAVSDGCEEKTLETVFEDFKEHYKDNSRIYTKAYHGIDALLCQLKKRGVKLGVVSNKAHFAVVDIMEYYFNGIFDVVIGEREGVPRKPSPESLLEAAEKLGGNVLYVGDSEVDVQTAKNAGLPMVAVTWGFRDKEELEAAGATVFAESAAELLDIIEGN